MGVTHLGESLCKVPDKSIPHLPREQDALGRGGEQEERRGRGRMVGGRAGEGWREEERTSEGEEEREEERTSWGGVEEEERRDRGITEGKREGEG